MYRRLSILAVTVLLFSIGAIISSAGTDKYTPSSSHQFGYVLRFIDETGHPVSNVHVFMVKDNFYHLTPRVCANTSGFARISFDIHKTNSLLFIIADGYRYLVFDVNRFRNNSTNEITLKKAIVTKGAEVIEVEGVKQLETSSPNYNQKSITDRNGLLHYRTRGRAGI